MNTTSLSLVALSLLTAFPASAQSLAPAVDATSQAASAVPFAGRHGLVFDAVGGVHWVANDGWKASFDPVGATFVPFLGSDAPHNYPVRFDLHAATVAGAVIQVGDAEVVRHDRTIHLERGGLLEQYVVGDAGIEQRFLFRSLPGRGELVLSIGVNGEFAVAPSADGHRLSNERGSFGYGRATAFDANGEQVPVETTWDGAGFRLVVPAAFVAKARLPLLVDPMIGNVQTLSTSTVAVVSPDLVHEVSRDLLVACWTAVFSQTDSDIYAHTLDASSTPIGSMMAIDISGTSWDKSRIACLDVLDRCMVVAECSSGSSMHWIGGRVLAPYPANVDPPVVIRQDNQSHLAPDVGGNPNANGGWFAVVYETVYQPLDHDIEAQMVDFAGVVASATMIVDYSLAFDHSPRISKSCGIGAPADQGWCITYRHDAGSFGQAMFDTLRWPLGGLLGSGGRPIAPLSTLIGPAEVAVSSPLATSPSLFLVIDTEKPSSNPNNVMLRGTIVDLAGNVVSANIPLTAPANSCSKPAVDTDGYRFVLSYQQQAGATVSMIASLVDYAGNQLLVHDQAAVVAGDAITGTAVRAMGSSGPQPRTREYALAWTTGGSTGNTVRVQRCHGVAVGGFATRATGCGPLSFTVQGEGAIGEQVTMQLQGMLGIGGWVFGQPTNTSLGCGSCLLGTSALVVLPGPTLSFTIPANGFLVGQSFALQGFDFGPGTCLGAFWLSNTADMTIR